LKLDPNFGTEPTLNFGTKNPLKPEPNFGTQTPLNFGTAPLTLMNSLHPAVRQWYADIGARGGSARSDRKTAAARLNATRPRPNGHKPKPRKAKSPVQTVATLQTGPTTS